MTTCKEKAEETDPVIDEDTGTVNVYRMLPQVGDSVLITNYGYFFQVQNSGPSYINQKALTLTSEDVDALREGRVTWH